MNFRAVSFSNCSKYSICVFYCYSLLKFYQPMLNICRSLLTTQSYPVLHFLLTTAQHIAIVSFLILVRAHFIDSIRRALNPFAYPYFIISFFLSFFIDAKLTGSTMSVPSFYVYITYILAVCMYSTSIVIASHHHFTLYRIIYFLHVSVYIFKQIYTHYIAMVERVLVMNEFIYCIYHAV